MKNSDVSILLGCDVVMLLLGYNGVAKQADKVGSSNQHVVSIEQRQ